MKSEHLAIQKYKILFILIFVLQSIREYVNSGGAWVKDMERFS